MMGRLPSSMCTGLLLTKIRRMSREMALLLTNSNSGTGLIIIELSGTKCCSHLEEVLIGGCGGSREDGSEQPRFHSSKFHICDTSCAIQMHDLLCHSVNFAQAIPVILQNYASIVLFHISSNCKICNQEVEHLTFYFSASEGSSFQMDLQRIKKVDHISQGFQYI